MWRRNPQRVVSLHAVQSLLPTLTLVFVLGCHSPEGKLSTGKYISLVNSGFPLTHHNLGGIFDLTILKKKIINININILLIFLHSILLLIKRQEDGKDRSCRMLPCNILDYN